MRVLVAGWINANWRSRPGSRRSLGPTTTSWPSSFAAAASASWIGRTRAGPEYCAATSLSLGPPAAACSVRRAIRLA